MAAHAEGAACRPDPERCSGPHVAGAQPDHYAEASRILSEVARRAPSCDHGDRETFCMSELEAEVASLLRKAAR